MASISRSRLRLVWLAVTIVALSAVAAALVVRWKRPVREETGGTLNVPLGVEQAAIVTYSGPLVVVAPYKWGVAVNVRIANVTEQPGKRIYDVRYIVNRAGTFDLRDYLVAADGSKLAGLPSFQFTGDPKLSKNLDTRIQETEEVTVEIGGRYYETLAALAVFWIAWLLLLLFWRRPKRVTMDETAPAGPTLAEMLQNFMAQLEAGNIDAAAKARLEMLLLRRWRSELALEGAPMSTSVEAIAGHPQTGEGLRKLQRWLHDPRAGVSPAEIVQVVRPYTVEPAQPDTSAKP